MQAACKGSATTSEDTTLKQGTKAKTQTVIPWDDAANSTAPGRRDATVDTRLLPVYDSRRSSSLPLASDPKTIRSDVA